MKFRDQVFVKPGKGQKEEVSRHLYIAGVGDLLGTDSSALKQFLSEFGPLEAKPPDHEGVYMPEGRRYCFASFLNIEDSKAAYTYFQAQQSIPLLNVSKVQVRYAFTMEHRSPQEPECTSVTSEIIVPGLSLIENFLSELDESSLLDLFSPTSESWKDTLNRRVQVIQASLCLQSFYHIPLSILGLPLIIEP